MPIVAIILGVLVIAGLMVWRLWPESQPETALPGEDKQAYNNLADPNTLWTFSQEEWTPSSMPPRCGDPFEVGTPADLSLASAVLYPGQTRGGDYKPHGGLRFDGKKNEDITVRAPFDAMVVNGSRYIEQGETQYLFTFINACGLAYRLDHLLTLSPELQKVADTLPAATQDSRTTRFEQPITVKKGDVLATAVGFKKTANVSFDFGLYDLRTQNEASRTEAFAKAHMQDKEFGWYGVCWLSWLGGNDRARAEALPAGDQAAGKTSDYCK